MVARLDGTRLVTLVRTPATRQIQAYGGISYYLFFSNFSSKLLSQAVLVCVALILNLIVGLLLLLVVWGAVAGALGFGDIG